MNLVIDYVLPIYGQSSLHKETCRTTCAANYLTWFQCNVSIGFKWIRDPQYEIDSFFKKLQLIFLSEKHTIDDVK